MIAGFEKPDSGKVWIGENDVTRVPPYRRDVGIVFQSYALFPHMNVAENVRFGLRMRRVPEQQSRQRVHEVLSLVELADKTKRFPRELSGGEQQRVALARVLAIHPSVILFDEPLSNLDAKLRKEMRFEIRRLQRETRTTAIYVTHDQEEAMAIADVIAVMNEGRLEQVGTPEEVYDAPSTRFVAEFIGGSNILDVTIEGLDGGFAIGSAGDGLLVKARLPKGISLTDISLGTSRAVSIKPESIRLVDLATADRGPFNRCRVRIETVVRIGSGSHAIVALPDGRTLDVHTPQKSLVSSGRNADSYAEWEANDCVLLVR
jgi:ABC-type Fe3+/spermidine/putrescine transport system ATPase subunit